jgi:hypothetical protein
MLVHVDVIRAHLKFRFEAGATRYGHRWLGLIYHTTRMPGFRPKAIPIRRIHARFQYLPFSADDLSGRYSKNMKATHWILIAVTAALVGWAGVETHRLSVARKELAKSIALNQSISQKAELAHIKYAQAKIGQK